MLSVEKSFVRYQPSAFLRIQFSLRPLRYSLHTSKKLFPEYRKERKEYRRERKVMQLVF